MMSLIDWKVKDVSPTVEFWSITMMWWRRRGERGGVGGAIASARRRKRRRILRKISASTSFICDKTRYSINISTLSICLPVYLNAIIVHDIYAFTYKYMQIGK